jgi:RNA polymerase primary sigma factor
MDAEQAWLDDSPREQTHEIVRRSRSGAMPVYLEQICSTPLLTADQERELFRQMNYLRYRANAIRSALSAIRPSTRKMDEIDELLSRANALRNRIVVANTRLVVSIVKKFADEKNRFDELLSEGITCLMRAVDKFDFDRGFRLSTYATMAVQRDLVRSVKRSHRDRTRFATGAPDTLNEQLNNETTPDQVHREFLGLSNRVTRLLNQLDDREQFIVKARCGLVEVGSKPTFSKLGEKLGVSKERVRQLELRAMTKLRTLAAKHKLTMPEA